MAEFIREDSLAIIADMAPNEVRTSAQPSASFSSSTETLTILSLRIDTAGRDVTVCFAVEQFTAGAWVELSESCPRLLEPDSVAHAGTLRLRLRVRAGPLGATGGFDAGILIVILPALGSDQAVVVETHGN